ncbi:Lysozyme inhibitor LprI N-terminal domain-containing protein [Azospirillaceae bacterium]|nr:hypothetical protein MTCCP1_00019 [uncultured bacterium]
MKRAVLLCALLSGPVMAADPDFASHECRYRPSFNCAKADEPVSQEICITPDLLQTDCALGYAYRDARDKAGSAGDAAIQKDQKDWIAARDAACRKSPAGELAPCLKTRTVQQIRRLVERHALPVAGKIYEQYSLGKPKAPLSQEKAK